MLRAQSFINLIQGVIVAKYRAKQYLLNFKTMRGLLNV
jgi:hypothetical protein